MHVAEARYLFKRAGEVNRCGRACDKKAISAASHAWRPPMSAIFLNKRLISRIAYFALGVVGTLVFLRMSGVQRLNSWTILASWLLLLAAFWIFGNRRTP
jgi:hypothetical protein